MGDPVRIRAPLAPVVITVIAIVVGLVVGLVTGSLLSYIGVMAVGISFAFVLAVRHGLAAHRQLQAATELGQPRPWFEWVWPSWSKRVLKIYLGVLGVITAIGVVGIVIAAIVQAFHS